MPNTDLMTELNALEAALQAARARGDVALVERLEPQIERLWAERRQQLAEGRPRGARDWQRTITWRGPR